MQVATEAWGAAAPHIFAVPFPENI